VDPGGGGLVAVDEQGLMQQEPLGRAAAWEPWGRPFERRPAQPVAGGLQPRRDLRQLGAARRVGDRPPKPAPRLRVGAVAASADPHDFGG
jgi:hypothetical protein